MRLRGYFFIPIVILMFLSFSRANALTYPNNSIGQDISWPNCKNHSFTPSDFGIVGVGGGLSFHSNPCIGEEAALYRQNLSLYVNTGFPGSPRDQAFRSWPLSCSSTNEECLAYNYGYNAGKFTTDYSLSRGVVSNNWWLDVETINSWSSNPNINRMSLVGESDAIKDSVKPLIIGYYSFPPGWKDLTGNWQNNLPNWVASNSNYENVAALQCSGYSFTGGKTLLTQYIGKLDLDISC